MNITNIPTAQLLRELERREKEESSEFYLEVLMSASRALQQVLSDVVDTEKDVKAGSIPIIDFEHEDIALQLSLTIENQEAKFLEYEQ